MLGISGTKSLRILLWKDLGVKRVMVQTLRYGRRPMVEAHSTVYNGEGLEFKGVFISIAPDLCENLLKWIYSVENGS